MNTENAEVKLLSDDELDLLSDDELNAVAGGKPNNLVDVFVRGFLRTCPQGGYDSFAKVFAGCI